MYVILLHPLPQELSPQHLSSDDYTLHAGSFVVEYDPDANNGAGLIVSTSSVDDSKRYSTLQLAVDHYRSVSTVQPHRADGKPNRPLTMYSAEVLRYDVAKQLYGGSSKQNGKQDKGSNNL